MERWCKSCGEPDSEKKSDVRYGGFTETSIVCIRPSRPLSLELLSPTRKINSLHRSRLHTLDVIIHRFEETIGGRAYHIEVTPVKDRWRAQICRLPGMPTAVMPFYGQTPDEAARQLTEWLALAYRRHTSSI